MTTPKRRSFRGRWLMAESGGPGPGVDRLGRRLWKLRGVAGFQPMMSVPKDVAGAAGVAISPRQKEALDGIARVLRLS